MVSTPLSPVSTAGAVAGQLREWIHAGRYGPGERLPSQRELAQVLGVSRVSVREGLRSLVEAGYLEVHRGAAGGAFVTELSQPMQAWRRRLRGQVGELDELVEHRIAIEGHLAYLAALRGTQRDLSAIRGAARTMKSAPDEAGGHREFRRLDTEFHRAVGVAGRNRRLLEAAMQARNEMFLPYDMLSFAEPRDTVLADHQAIYQAIRDGDAQRARALMAEHIHRTRAQLRSFVLDDPPPGPAHP